MPRESAPQPGLNNFLNWLMEQLGLHNDAALSRELEVAPPVISKMRHARLALGPTLMLNIHEKYGYTFKDMRAMLEADPA